MIGRNGTLGDTMDDSSHDYSRHTEADLREKIASIDPAKFPQRSKSLMLELHRRMLLADERSRTVHASMVKRVLPKFEHRAQPVLSPHRFLIRLAHSGIIAFALIVVSLLIGMVGYHVLEGVSWIDAFLNASMLLGGMGPVTVPVTFGGKLFAGLYALYCGLAVILVAGVILAPVAHRILHTFHMESRNR